MLLEKQEQKYLLCILSNKMRFAIVTLLFWSTVQDILLAVKSIMRRHVEAQPRGAVRSGLDEVSFARNRRRFHMEIMIVVYGVKGALLRL